jgi:hypothetical protein
MGPLSGQALVDYIDSKREENTNRIGSALAAIINNADFPAFKWVEGRYVPVVRGASGSDIVANISLGEVKKYCKLDGGANDALIVVPLEASGLVADDTLRDYDDLSALLAGATNEQTTMGRKTISASVTINVDDTNNRVDIDVPDQVWTGATGNAIAKLSFCYDGDTTTGTDSNITPLTFHSFDITPDGSDVTAQIATAGFFRAQ